MASFDTILIFYWACFYYSLQYKRYSFKDIELLK